MGYHDQIRGERIEGGGQSSSKLKDKVRDGIDLEQRKTLESYTTLHESFSRLFRFDGASL